MPLSFPASEIRFGLVGVGGSERELLSWSQPGVIMKILLLLTV